MFVNIHAWTPSWAVPAITVATIWIQILRIDDNEFKKLRTWLQNIGLGGTAMTKFNFRKKNCTDGQHTFHVVAKLEVGSKSDSLGHSLVYARVVTVWMS